MGEGRREENTLSQTALSMAAQKRAHLWRRMVARKYCYLMLIPVAAYFIIFCYVPMYGLLISFQNYKVFKGIWGSDWVGLKNFAFFFQSQDAGRTIRNTVLYSVDFLVLDLIFGVTIALMLYNLRMKS